VNLFKAYEQNRQPVLDFACSGFCDDDSQLSGVLFENPDDGMKLIGHRWSETSATDRRAVGSSRVGGPQVLLDSFFEQVSNLLKENHVRVLTFEQLNPVMAEFVTTEDVWDEVTTPTDLERKDDHLEKCHGIIPTLGQRLGAPSPTRTPFREGKQTVFFF